jgi:hypothetical protein
VYWKRRDKDSGKYFGQRGKVIGESDYYDSDCLLIRFGKVSWHCKNADISHDDPKKRPRKIRMGAASEPPTQAPPAGSQCGGEPLQSKDFLGDRPSCTPTGLATGTAVNTAAPEVKGRRYARAQQLSRMCRGSRRHACEGYYQDVATTSASECILICALTLTSLWHDVHAAKALQRQD